MSQANNNQVKKWVMVAAVLLFSTTAGFAGGYIGSKGQGRTSTTISAQKEVVSSESQLISSIAKAVGPSVVSVNVTGQAASSGFDSFFGGGSQAQQSAGTGIIVGDNIIMTNRHVVPAGTTSVNVVLSDGTELDNVQVIGRTSSTDSLDIAFLKVTDTKGHKLVPAKIGNSSSMQVGDKVVAIGNALGQFQNTVTSGIISGYGRDVQAGDDGQGSTENLQDLFQTDAAINPGNSGGPLVNVDGQVIGVNVAIAGDAQGIGFAIPINDVKSLINSVLTTGKFERPFLGVRYVSITPDLASQYSLPVKQGAYIPADSPSNIVAGSPASKAGLKPGDIITKVNNTSISSTNTLSTVLGRSQVGQQVSLTVLRAGETLQLSATLAAAPSS